jgi:hypothetical protein
MKHTVTVQVTTTGLENCAQAYSDPLSSGVQLLLELWSSFFQEGLRKGPSIEPKIRGNGIDNDLGLKDKTKDLFKMLTSGIHHP